MKQQMQFFFLLEKHKLMVEGAGAVSVAAIMHVEESKY